jgi:long-subunit fatty acid transport protein
MTAVLGAWVRPVKGLEIGLSSRIVPVPINAKGSVRISGASATFAKIDADIDAELKFKLPATFQAGVRYYGLKDGREEWDIEADYVWEQWSGMDAFRLDMKEDKILQAGMEIGLSDLTLTRNYQDTHSVRLGGQWNILDGSFNPVRGLGLTLRLGGWWESAAMPNEYTVADFAAFQRFGIGSGLSIAYRGIEVGLSYGHVFQPDRTVAAGTGRVYQQILTPTGAPMEPTGDGGMPYAVNEGKYSSSFDVIALGLTIHWDELVHGYDDAPATDATP